MPTLSIHVSDEVFHEVSAMADQLDRSRSWVVGEALEPYLEHCRWVTERTKKAMDELRDGRVTAVPHDVAVAQIMAYVASKQ
jgi:predicted transcriptional regulator